MILFIFQTRNIASWKIAPRNSVSQKISTRNIAPRNKDCPPHGIIDPEKFFHMQMLLPYQ